MNTTYMKSAALALALALVACSSTPITTPTLDAARAAYREANADASVSAYAPLEFRQASEALERANRAAAERESIAEIDQLAYIAKQRIEAARELARAKSAEQQTQAAARERDAVRLEARTAEAERARSQAEQARTEAQAAQAEAAAAQSQAAAAQSQAEAARSQAEAAQQAQRDAEARITQYEQAMAELQARKTPRGMVVTIGDVLFDVGQANLKERGMAGMRKLADVLKENPERRVMIEGFTDSTGSDRSNQELSERRATAVRDALASMGVEAARIAVRGYGERFPVASNKTAGERQLNRRVEIILSDESGNIPPR